MLFRPCTRQGKDSSSQGTGSSSNTTSQRTKSPVVAGANSTHRNSKELPTIRQRNPHCTWTRNSSNGDSNQDLRTSKLSGVPRPQSQVSQRKKCILKNLFVHFFACIDNFGGKSSKEGIHSLLKFTEKAFKQLSLKNSQTLQFSYFCADSFLCCLLYLW